jgi:hypothetical protein
MARAACSNPAGAEGNQVYNTTYHVMQFCNGTDWVAMGALSPAAGGGGQTEVCTWDDTVNGKTGPSCDNTTPTWAECALQTCTEVMNVGGYNYDCLDSSAYDAYLSIMDECQEGSCDSGFAIWNAVFICVDW